MKLSIAAALALLVALPAVGNAQAATPEARPDTSACEGAPDSGFTDTEGNVHKPRIDCVAWRDVTSGTTETTYSPGGLLSRGQIATFMNNALVARGIALTEPTADYFDDDNGTFHEANTNRLAQAGIFRTDTRTFQPKEAATRAFMARVTAATLRHAGVTDPAGVPDYYSDDTGHPDQASINLITAHGVVTGKGDGTFGPEETLSRAQMATFLARALAVLIEEGNFDALTTSGTSDDVWDQAVPMDAMSLMRWSHEGSGNFAIVARESDGSYGGLVANTIGAVSGIAPINFSRDAFSLYEISADGPWTVEIVGMAAARDFITTISGSTDDVLDGRGLGGETVEATYQGDSNFAVVAYEQNGSYNGLVFNEIGPYEGAALLPTGTRWLEVTGEGAWTLTIRQN